MRTNLGSVHVGDHEPTNIWLGNLKRYASVRFFGFTRGRCFIGMIVGAKGKSKLTLTQDALIQVEEELAALKRKQNTLLQDHQAKA